MKRKAKPDNLFVGTVPAKLIPEGCHWDEIRRKLIETDFIEAVVTLGDKIFYGTGLSPCFLVLRWVKARDRVKKILMVDGTKILTQKRAQNKAREYPEVKAEFDAAAEAVKAASERLGALLGQAGLGARGANGARNSRSSSGSRNSRSSSSSSDSRSSSCSRGISDSSRKGPK